MNLIQAEENTPALTEWAQRLGSISINREWWLLLRSTAVSWRGQRNGGVTTTAKCADYARRNNLVAIVSLTEMVVLKPALTLLGAGMQKIIVSELNN